MLYGTSQSCSITVINKCCVVTAICQSCCGLWNFAICSVWVMERCILFASRLWTFADCGDLVMERCSLLPMGYGPLQSVESGLQFVAIGLWNFAVCCQWVLKNWSLSPVDYRIL